VRAEISGTGALSETTSREIHDCKAPRARHYAEKRDFKTYEIDIKATVETRSMDENVSILNELPGIGIPVVSTILHFIYPDTVPIVGARAV